MALEIKFKITSVKDKFKLSDTTGVYNVTTNPTGYGAPNVDISDFDGSTVEVTFPGETVPVILVSFPTLPSIDLNDIFEITAADLGVTTLEPGVYTFKFKPYTSVEEDDYTVCKKYAYVYPIQCCISKRKKSLSFTCSTKEEICELAFAERTLKAAVDAACSGNEKEAQTIIDDLWEKCGCQC